MNRRAKDQLQEWWANDWAKAKDMFAEIGDAVGREAAAAVGDIRDTAVLDAWFGPQIQSQPFGHGEIDRSADLGWSKREAPDKATATDHDLGWSKPDAKTQNPDQAAPDKDADLGWQVRRSPEERAQAERQHERLNEHDHEHER